jgi:hypothetical protein
MERFAVVALVLASQAALAAPAAQGRLVPVKEPLPFTVLGPLLAGMPPLEPPPPCPPKCMDPLAVGNVPLGHFALLFWPAKKDVHLKSLSVLVVDPASGTLVAHTEDACAGCGATLPAQPKGGHLFRLDPKAVESLSAALKQYPTGLRVHAAGSGDFRIELVRLD